MKLILKSPESLVNDRLNIFKKDIPCLDSSWHYHQEFELLFISQSNGMRFVGDSVSQFSAGDLVLVGPYLPHLWRNDSSYSHHIQHPKKVETIIVKFRKGFIGKDTFDLPEFRTISELLELSKFGVSFGKTTSNRLKKDLLQIVDLPAALQATKLLEILYQLAITQNRSVLSSTDMRQYTFEHAHRIDTVLKFISDNYDSYLTLNDVADIACLTPNSFCRFFKRVTNKSFTQFLNEVRIRNAARLLVQKNLPISEICYMVGYRSITNFNRQFKEIIGNTPKQYRANHT
ncbi:MAG: AraC family transcriptional regulator [Bacteroidota bacterium]